MTNRRTRLGTRLLVLALAGLGVLLILFALSRPSVSRFLAGGLLLAAAVVVRYNATRAADPARYSRSAQVRSLVWSVLIAVVFVALSLLLNELLGGG